MPDLISKADAYEHLRLDYDSDGSADDGWLDIFIPATSEEIALWLKDEWRLYVVEVDSEGAIVLDSDDEPVIELDSDGASARQRRRGTGLFDDLPRHAATAH